jgi:hypothetical protein
MIGGFMEVGDTVYIMTAAIQATITKIIGYDTYEVTTEKIFMTDDGPKNVFIASTPTNILVGQKE